MDSGTLDLTPVFWPSETNLSVCFTSFSCILDCFGSLWWPFTSHDTQGMSMLTDSIFGLGKASNQHWLLWRMREGQQLGVKPMDRRSEQFFLAIRASEKNALIAEIR